MDSKLASNDPLLLIRNVGIVPAKQWIAPSSSSSSSISSTSATSSLAAAAAASKGGGAWTKWLGLLLALLLFLLLGWLLFAQQDPLTWLRQQWALRKVRLSDQSGGEGEAATGEGEGEGEGEGGVYGAESSQRWRQAGEARDTALMNRNQWSRTAQGGSAKSNNNQTFTPSAADHSVHRPNTGKAGWCYVGLDHNSLRTCANVGVNDTCMSGDIFPSQAVCVNPHLRA